MPSFLFGGDVCWDTSKTRVRRIVVTDDEVAAAAQEADLFVVNLEGPIIKRESPIDKVGPVVSNCPDTIKVLCKMGVGAVTLANNHIMDHGERGLQDTLGILADEKISCFGLSGQGTALKGNEALSKEVEGVNVTMIGLCEREFNRLSDRDIGANALNDIEIFHQIREAKQQPGYLVILFHGGVEMHSLPSPDTVQRMRFLVDLGADCVIMHHSHCISGSEVYKGKAIYYGLGNMIFPYEGMEADPKWNTGYLVQMSITEDNRVVTRTLPFVQKYNNETLSLEGLSQESKVVFYESFANLSDQISSPNHLRAEWEKLCTKGDFQYLRYFTPPSRLNRLLAKLGISRLTAVQAMTLLNIIRNASHRERAICSLQQYCRGGGRMV